MGMFTCMFGMLALLHAQCRATADMYRHSPGPVFEGMRQNMPSNKMKMPTPNMASCKVSNFSKSPKYSPPDTMIKSTHRISNMGTITTAGNSSRPCVNRLLYSTALVQN